MGMLSFGDVRLKRVEGDGRLWKDANGAKEMRLSSFTHDGLDRVHWHPSFACVFVSVLIVARRMLQTQTGREHIPRLLRKNAKSKDEATHENGDTDSTIRVNCT